MAERSRYPTWPIHYGKPLPPVLWWWNPTHWLRLLHWLFFKPSHWKQYLYQADPELYRLENGRSAWSSFLHVAYWSPCLMGFLLTVSLSYLTLSFFTIFGVSVDWSGVVVGVTMGLVFGVLSGMTSGMVGVVTEAVGFGLAGGLLFGVGVSLVGITQEDATLGWKVGIVVFFLWCGVVFGAPFGTVSVTLMGQELFVGFLRFPIYFVLQWGKDEFILFDELSVFPHRRQVQLTISELKAGLLPGGAFSRLLRNPYQSVAAARGVQDFLSELTDPLAAWYSILASPILDAYIREPVKKLQFNSLPPVRPILLGRVANVFVDPSGGYSRTSEHIAWAISSRWQGPLLPWLQALSKILVTIEQTEQQEAGRETLGQEITVQRIEVDLALLQALPSGDEVYLSMLDMARALHLANMDEMAVWQPASLTTVASTNEAIRPDVMEILVALGDVAMGAKLYQAATSPITQPTMLNRAAGMLNQLADHIEPIRISERVILRAIVTRWQELIAIETRRMGDRAVREMSASERRALPGGGVRNASLWQRDIPYDVPYVTGPPVANEIFVGRNHIHEQIVSSWQDGQNPDSIILYGHRRMGKTSVLNNLRHFLPKDTLLATIDLSGERATIEHLGDFYLSMAEAVHRAARTSMPDLPAPDPTDYVQPKAGEVHFYRLLDAVLVQLPESGVLAIGMDEFEALQQAVEEGQLPQTAYNLIRRLSQNPRVALVMAGLHQLDEMSRDYTQAFHESYMNIKITYLDWPAAEQLITRPKPDFALNYDRGVVTEIYTQTHGQPLLIQRICQQLIFNLNHQLFDARIDREHRILSTDLDAVLTDQFVLHESRYFDGIWTDQIKDFPAQQAVLTALARSQAPQSPALLARQANLSPAAVTGALVALAKRDLVEEGAEGWALLMPLFQRWLRLRSLAER